jgi:thiamine-phosphate pyrophosphorylase
LIGRSCRDLPELQRAKQSGVDFGLLGPIYETPSKAALNQPLLGLEHLKQTSQALAGVLPVVAVGGITPDNAPLVRQCGASGVAAIRSVLTSTDPAQTALALLQPSCGLVG